MITLEQFLAEMPEEHKETLESLAETRKTDINIIYNVCWQIYNSIESQVSDAAGRYSQAVSATISQLDAAISQKEEQKQEDTKSQDDTNKDIAKKQKQQKAKDLNKDAIQESSKETANDSLRSKIVNKFTCQVPELSGERIEMIHKLLKEYVSKIAIPDDIMDTVFDNEIKTHFKLTKDDIANLKKTHRRLTAEKLQAQREAKEKEIEEHEAEEKRNVAIRASRFPQIEGCFIPRQYKVDKSSAVGSITKDVVTKSGEIVKVKVCNCQAMITGRYKSLDSEAELVEIVFTAPNTSNGSVEWRKIVVPFEATMTVEAFKKEITPKGFAATGKGIGETIDYFEACMNANFGVEGSAFKCSSVFDSTGWKDERCTMFVAGNRMYYDDNGILNEKEVIFTNDGVAKNLEPHGTLEGWLEAVKYVACFERVRYVMYESLASALLTPLGVSPHTDAIVGSTSQGKTTATQAGASQIGNPDDKGTGIILSGDLTVAGANAMLKTYRDLPTYFDETTGMKEAVRKVFGYVVGNGQESIRSNQNGTARERKSHNTIAFATAEESLVSEFANDGADVRIVTLKKRMIPENSQALVDAAKTGMKANYGHILKLFIAKIFQHRHELSGWFELAKTRLAGMATEDRMKRKATYFACAEVAGILLEEIFDEIGMVTKNPMDVINCMWNDAIEDQEKPMAIRALQCAYEFITAATNQHFIVNGITKDDNGNLLKKGDIYGWITDGTFDINKKQLDKELMNSGFTNLKSIYESWYNDRTIIKNEKQKEKDRGYTTKVYHFVSVDALQKTQFRAMSLSRYHVYEALDMDTTGVPEIQPESKPETKTTTQQTVTTTPQTKKPLVW